MIQAVRGPWSIDRIGDFLASAIVPLRLAAVGPEGWPVTASLWFLHDEGVLWCATGSTARVVRWLERDPRCGFEISPDAPPYRGVRGRGLGTVVPERGREVLPSLVDRYVRRRDTAFARWLLARCDAEVALRIEIKTLSSWDFTRRMNAC